MRPGGNLASNRRASYLLLKREDWIDMEQAVNWLEMWEWLKSAFAVLGVGGVTIGGAAAAAYGLFKWLGERWIDNKFEKQMEAYKTEQARELERLRHKINGVFDRTLRLHSKEYEVLPDLWGRLVEAHGWAWGYVSPFQQYADVMRMSDEELDEFLKDKKFSNAHKRDIATAHDKQQKYTEVFERYRCAEVMDKIRDFNVSFRKTGIFVKPDIKADMGALIDIIRGAVTEHQMNFEMKPNPRWRSEYKKLQTAGNELFEKIELAVANRLWDSTTTDV